MDAAGAAMEDDQKPQTQLVSLSGTPLLHFVPSSGLKKKSSTFAFWSLF
jgi:hypothetical protein